LSGTVVEQLERAASAYSSLPAFGERVDGVWRFTSWRDYRDQVFRAAAGLVALGVEPGTGVAIHSSNRPEWAIADFAAIAAGAIPTGLFVTNAIEQCAYVLRHTEARVAVIDTVETLAKLRSVRDRTPQLARFVLLDGEAEGEDVLPWRRLLELADASAETELARRIDALRTEDVATLIYTSGTTGTPKGVELTHANLLFLAPVASALAHARGANERHLSYLPLAHIAEQMLTLHAPLHSGSCVHYLRSLEELPRALGEIRPTHFFGVPRVWEKLQAAIEGALAKAPRSRRRLVEWARRQGLAAARAVERGGSAPLTSRIADRLVLRRLRAKIGFARAASCYSAAAPIARSTLEFFYSLGLPVYEIYGLSETTGGLTSCLTGAFRIGSVGRALEGVEVRIADDGEIVARGRNIFRGYRADPESTRAAIDDDGWFHTGDIGAIDRDGFLSITGRKKELLVTSGGKKLAPAPIEGRLRAVPGVGHAVLVGEQRKFIAALLTLDEAALPSLLASLGMPTVPLDEAARDPRLVEFLDAEIERVNASLARYESVRAFRVLPRDFSIDGGELTPTLKLRRAFVTEKYADEIAAIYRE
jgi:long-subunit acyl-CoA synthetase (AMP-forming)